MSGEAYVPNRYRYRTGPGVAAPKIVTAVTAQPADGPARRGEAAAPGRRGGAYPA